MKTIRHLLKNSLGFSLVQVMVASSLMGVLAVALLQLQQNQQRVAVTAEVDAEIIQATNSIQTLLFNQNTCIATVTRNNANSAPFVVKNRADLVESDYRPINMIYHVKETASPVDPSAIPWAFAASDVNETSYRLESFGPTPPYSVVPGKLAIAKMGITLVRDTAAGVAYAEIAIDFIKKNKLAYVSSKRKMIPLQIVMDDTGNFISCFSNISNAINTAVDRACKGNAAFPYTDPVTGEITCYHEIQPLTCPDGEVLTAVDIPGSVPAASSLSGQENTKTPRFICRRITASCPSTATHIGVITGLQPTTPLGPGDSVVTPTCINIPRCTAPDITSYDADGTFKCVSRTCPAQHIGIIHENQWKCISLNCPPNHLLTMTPSGPQCKDSACGNSGLAGTSGSPESGSQQYLVGFDSNGDKICRDLFTGDANSCKFGSKLRLNGSDGSIQQECCPDCDGGEKANYCEGSVFYSGNGCSVCRGSKSLTHGCPTPGTYCENGCPLTGPCTFGIGVTTVMSECNTICPGGVPQNQGDLSDWSSWSGCGYTWQITETRTRTCNNGRCGGNCNGLETSETRDCPIEGGKTRQACLNVGGSVVQVGSTFICKRWSSSCWTGWTQYQNYTSTYGNCVGIGSEGNGYCDPVHCPGTWARDSATVCSGSHAFSNDNTIEYQQQNKKRKGSYPGCACHTDIGVSSVSAVRNSIGCY